ncbi:MAG: SurA N-terminal domain-containing protein [Magnetococcales bacterium]|nr:SurA N-terminal domain-containing protein [Magnetococcales bacterium]
MTFPRMMYIDPHTNSKPDTFESHLRQAPATLTLGKPERKLPDAKVAVNSRSMAQNELFIRESVKKLEIPVSCLYPSRFQRDDLFRVPPPHCAEICTMLNVLRKGANTFIVKLLLAFIALSFMVWGVGDYVNKRSNEPFVEAKRWSIGPREFAIAYDNEFQRLRQRFGNALDKKAAESMGLKQKTLNAMINRNLLLAKSREWRLTVSNESLRTIIANTEAFQNDGKFDPQRYELVLQNNRMSPRDYEQKLKTDLVAAQIKEMLSEPLFIPNLLIEDVYDLENEKRSIDVLTLPFEAFHASIQPSDDELTAYLEKNRDHYLSPVQVRLAYVVLSADSLKGSVSVADAESDEYYNEHKEEYRQEEKRQARHILFKIGSGVTEDQAREKAKAAQGRIEKGESFEAVARELSEDVSASQGGDLGIIVKGMMIKPFEDAVFAQPANSISPPVLTPFGIHLIRVDAIFPAAMRPEQEVKAEIKTLLTDKKAMDLVYERSSVLEDQVFSSGDLKAIAQDLNLRYKETELFSRNDADKLEAIEQETKFLDAAFATAKGELSPVIELPEGRFCVLKVLDRNEPRPLTLAEAKEQLLKNYRQEKSTAMAQEQMETIKKDLAQGTPWDKAITAHPALKKETVTAFQRVGQTPKMDPAVRTAAFKLTLENPVFRTIIETPTGLSLMRLTNIEKADSGKLTEQERKKIALHFKEVLGVEQLTAYLDGLWQTSAIRINYKILDSF